MHRQSNSGSSHWGWNLIISLVCSLAIFEVLAVEEPSANKEPSAQEEPSAGKEPSANKEPSAQEEPSANKEPSAQEEPSADKEPPTDQEPRHRALLSRRLQALDRVSLDFDQQVLRQIGVSSGQLAFSRPGQFYLSLQPEDLLVISDGSVVYEVDRMLEQVTLRRFVDQPDDGPLGLLLNPEKTLMQFNVERIIESKVLRPEAEAALDHEVTERFVLSPIDLGQGLINRAEMVFHGTNPTSLIVEMVGGESVNFRFKRLTDLSEEGHRLFSKPSFEGFDVVDQRPSARGVPDGR